MIAKRREMPSITGLPRVGMINAAMKQFHVVRRLFLYAVAVPLLSEFGIKELVHVQPVSFCMAG